VVFEKSLSILLDERVFIDYALQNVAKLELRVVWEGNQKPCDGDINQSKTIL